MWVGPYLWDLGANWRIGPHLWDLDANWRIGPHLWDLDANWRIGPHLWDLDANWRIGPHLWDPGANRRHLWVGASRWVGPQLWIGAIRTGQTMDVLALNASGSKSGRSRGISWMISGRNAVNRPAAAKPPRGQATQGIVARGWNDGGTDANHA
jgi:hypothetical protein